MYITSWIIFILFMIIICEFIWLCVECINYSIYYFCVKIKKSYKELNKNYEKYMKLVQESTSEEKFMKYEKVSIFISLILRHKPEVINIKLDKNGYANVDELINGINNTSKYNITFEDLVHIVNTDEKQRYSFNGDKTLIRANQGHSINVDVNLEDVTKLPEVLFHGTDKKNIDNIKKEGLKRINRLHVHLTTNEEQAIKSAKRWGRKGLICVIDSDKMYKDGYVFSKSKNNVYLIEHIPAKYISYYPVD